MTTTRRISRFALIGLIWVNVSFPARAQNSVSRVSPSAPQVSNTAKAPLALSGIVHAGVMPCINAYIDGLGLGMAPGLAIPGVNTLVGLSELELRGIKVGANFVAGAWDGYDKDGWRGALIEGAIDAGLSALPFDKLFRSVPLPKKDALASWLKTTDAPDWLKSLVSRYGDDILQHELGGLTEKTANGVLETAAEGALAAMDQAAAPYAQPLPRANPQAQTIPPASIAAPSGFPTPPGPPRKSRSPGDAPGNDASKPVRAAGPPFHGPDQTIRAPDCSENMESRIFWTQAFVKSATGEALTQAQKQIIRTGPRQYIFEIHKADFWRTVNAYAASLGRDYALLAVKTSYMQRAVGNDGTPTDDVGKNLDRQLQAWVDEYRQAATVANRTESALKPRTEAQSIAATAQSPAASQRPFDAPGQDFNRAIEDLAQLAASQGVSSTKASQEEAAWMSKNQADGAVSPPLGIQYAEAAKTAKVPDVLFVAGVGNNSADSAKSSIILAQQFGVPVVNVVNQTELDGVGDVARAAVDKAFPNGASVEPATRSLGQQIIDRLMAGRPVNVVAHSQGALITQKATQAVGGALEDAARQGKITQEQARSWMSNVRVITLGGADGLGDWPTGVSVVRQAMPNDLVPQFFGAQPLGYPNQWGLAQHPLIPNYLPRLSYSDLLPQK